MKKLLKSKPWMIFTIIFLTPFVISLLLKDYGEFIIYGVYLLWIYSLGLILAKSINDRLKIISYAIVVVSIFLTTPLIFDYNRSIQYVSNHDNISLLIIGLFILHLLATVISFALTLRLIIDNLTTKAVDKYDRLMFYFSFVVYPLGIWIIQDKISYAIDKKD